MLDDLDLKLLHELRNDSRRSVRQLAKSINESPSTVYNRVKRLENNKVIKRFTICYDYEQLGLDTVAFVFVSIKPPENPQAGHPYIREIAHKIADVDGVYEVHIISGEFDLLVKIRSNSLKNIGELIIENLRNMPWVEKTMTNACFETILEEGQTAVKTPPEKITMTS